MKARMISDLPYRIKPALSPRKSFASDQPSFRFGLAEIYEWHVLAEVMPRDRRA